MRCTTLHLLYFTHLPIFVFFNDTATTEIYTLSLHDALPIWRSVDDFLRRRGQNWSQRLLADVHRRKDWQEASDRKSTRLNSSHLGISYAVFCLKKKSRYSTKTRCSRAAS